MTDTVTINVRVNNQTGSGIASVNSGFGKLRAAALALSPALLPVAAATAPIAAQMGAAGAAATAFTAAVIPQAKAMGEAADAEKKYQTAVAQHGKASQEAVKAEAAYLQSVKAMPPATREAAAGLAVMKDSYRQWSDSLADDTMPVFTHSFATLSAVFPKFTPLVKGASSELDRFVTIVAGGVASPGFDGFMARFSEFATSALRSATNGVLHLARAMNEGSGGGELSAFMDRAREVGPLVAETLRNLAQAALHLINAGGDLGVTMLTVANSLAKLVNAVPSEAISTFLQLYAAFKLVRMGAAALTAVTGASAVSNLRGFVRAARFGGVASAISGVVGQMSRLQRVAAGMGVLAGVAVMMHQLADGNNAPIEIDKLSTSLTTLAETGKVTGELKTHLGDMSESIAMVSKSASDNKIVKAVSDFGTWLGLANGPSVSKAKENIDAWDKSMANLVKGGKPKQAAAQYEILKKAWLAGGGSMERLKKFTDDYSSALADQKFEQKLATQAMGVFGEQAIATKSKLDAQKQSADGLRQAITALNDANRQGLSGMLGFEAAIDAASEAAEKNAGALRMKGGQLDLNSEKARNAAQALNELAAKTDEAATSARESGSSWSQVNGIYERGRNELIRSADAMGLNKTEARQLADQILKMPSKSSVLIEMRREDAIKGLNDVISKMKGVKGKSVTVNALTDDAAKALKILGFKVERLPNGQVRVSAKTGSAEAGIGRVKRMRDSLTDRTITIRTLHIQEFIRKVQTSFARARDDYNLKMGKATGGIVGAAGGGPRSNLTLVGEQGPELVRLPYGSRVIPAGATRALTEPKNPTRAQRRAIEERKRELEARREAIGGLTISHFGRMAGYRNDEFRNALKPGDIGRLVGGLNQWRGIVQRATHGSTERKLLRDLDVAGRALIKNSRLHDKVSAALEKARGKLDDLRQAASQMRESVSNGILGSANITRAASGAESGVPLRVSTVMDHLVQSRDKASSFAKALGALKKRGLNKKLLADIAEAGIEGGGLQTAEALMRASGSEIRRMNELQRQINDAAKKSGKTAAEAMYGAGIKTAEGVVRGLERNKKRIERAMEGIAKALEAAIKKALNVRGKAHGGIVGAAGGGPRSALTLVGEQGPELVRMPFGSTVYPAGQSRQMMRGASRPEPVVIELRSSGSDVDEFLLKVLRRAIQTRGGNAQLVLTGRAS